MRDAFSVDVPSTARRNARAVVASVAGFRSRCHGAVLSTWVETLPLVVTSSITARTIDTLPHRCHSLGHWARDSRRIEPRFESRSQRRERPHREAPDGGRSTINEIRLRFTWCDKYFSFSPPFFLIEGRRKTLRSKVCKVDRRDYWGFIRKATMKFQGLTLSSFFRAAMYPQYIYIYTHTNVFILTWNSKMLVETLTSHWHNLSQCR